jgi:hypothetical protein
MLPPPLLQDAAAVTMTAAKAGYFEARFFHKVFCEEFANARGHFSPINSVAFSPDGTSFVTGAEEGNVRLHHFDADYVSGWVAGWECVCVCWSAGERFEGGAAGVQEGWQGAPGARALPLSLCAMVRH